MVVNYFYTNNCDHPSRFPIITKKQGSIRPECGLWGIVTEYIRMTVYILEQVDIDGKTCSVPCTGNGVNRCMKTVIQGVTVVGLGMVRSTRTGRRLDIRRLMLPETAV